MLLLNSLEQGDSMFKALGRFGMLGHTQEKTGLGGTFTAFFRITKRLPPGVWRRITVFISRTHGYRAHGGWDDNIYDTAQTEPKEPFSPLRC